jgi:hypothetical protein
MEYSCNCDTLFGRAECHDALTSGRAGFADSELHESGPVCGLLAPARPKYVFIFPSALSATLREKSAIKDPESRQCLKIVE